MVRRTKRSAHTDLFGSSELARHARCAVIVAHPDDEVFGAGGLISRLKDVTVLHITDGVPRNGYYADAGYSSRSEYARALSEESRRALALANIPSERIVEFGLVGERTPHQLADLTRRVAAFLQHTSPDIVLTHPYEGGHPDHDATAFATHAALRLLQQHGFKPPSVFEMALHPARDGNGRVLDFLPNEAAETTTLLLDKKACELKRQMFACFKTSPPSRENSFARERFRRPPRYDFTAPPRPQTLNYEKLATIDEDEWQALVYEAWTNLFPSEQKSH